MPLNFVDRVPDRVPIRNALISLWDKTGLEELAAGLIALQPEITFFSTGGTLEALRRAFPGHAERIRAVESLTGNPEIQGGLVKTLDYRIYLGLLTEPYNPDHRRALKDYGVPSLDLVAVNLYPFLQAVREHPGQLEYARANIDIGGPTMIRAAAKNFHRVLVLTRADQYAAALEELRQNQGHSRLAQRFERARDAFRLIRDYDQAIAEALSTLDPVAALGAYRVEEGWNG